MTALCIETACVAASVTDARSQAAVCAALAFAMLGVIMNVLAIGLLELCAHRSPRRCSALIAQGLVGVGTLLPVLASASVFVGTQPLEAIVAAAAIILVGVVGLVMVLWFDRPTG